MSALSTAEFERLSLIAAGTDPTQIPSILDTATWRRLLLVSLTTTAGKTFVSPNGDTWVLSVDDDGIITITKV
jgi:hypothetical protein